MFECITIRHLHLHLTRTICNVDVNIIAVVVWSTLLTTLFQLPYLCNHLTCTYTTLFSIEAITDHFTVYVLYIVQITLFTYTRRQLLASVGTSVYDPKYWVAFEFDQSLYEVIMMVQHINRPLGSMYVLTWLAILNWA